MVPELATIQAEVRARGQEVDRLELSEAVPRHPSDLPALVAPRPKRGAYRPHGVSPCPVGAPLEAGRDKVGTVYRIRMIEAAEGGP